MYLSLNKLIWTSNAEEMESNPEKKRAMLVSLLEEEEEEINGTSMDTSIPIQELAHPPEDAGMVSLSSTDNVDVETLLVMKDKAKSQQTIKNTKLAVRAIRKCQLNKESAAIGIPVAKKKKTDLLQDLVDVQSDAMQTHNLNMSRVALAQEKMAEAYMKLCERFDG